LWLYIEAGMHNAIACDISDMNDIPFAFSPLCKSPACTGLASLTFAIAIGMNAAVDPAIACPAD
jgi:hypothetical protein